MHFMPRKGSITQINNAPNRKNCDKKNLINKDKTECNCMFLKPKLTLLVFHHKYIHRDIRSDCIVHARIWQAVHFSLFPMTVINFYSFFCFVLGIFIRMILLAMVAKISFVYCGFFE